MSRNTIDPVFCSLALLSYVLLCLLAYDYAFAKSIMMTSSNGSIFRRTGPLCGEFTGHRWIPLTKASAASFDVFFDRHLNKRLNKQSWGWWIETPSRPLWRHCNDWTTTKQEISWPAPVPLTMLIIPVVMFIIDTAVIFCRIINQIVVYTIIKWVMHWL